MKNQDRAGRAHTRNLRSRASDGRRSREPIAIVGMACRFPKADTLGAFWRQLEAGESAVAEGSPDSGPGRHADLCRDAMEHDALRHFAFVSGIDEFDAEFFRIAPLEAQLLDPQQRLLLETSWEALEDAGIAPGPLRESVAGVYVGISNNDYGAMIPRVSGVAPSLYAITGNCFSTSSGRIAYVLGLKGPALATDTACSSSLVATHQAVTALQQGEVDLALAGGVSALLSPPTTEAFASAGMLSPTGRCWTFDEAADGFVRGEGCGVVVLKRLGEAEASGDRIWAVIRGSAVNQDGASEGLLVPDGLSQERVIEEALKRAGLAPSQIDYLEAHGTGTKVGDPIELRAVSAAYGRGREAEKPLLIGSVKTNIGHLSAAAGVAGLVKVVLAMNRGVIPKHLNFRNPTSRVDWNRLPIRVTAEPVEWPSAPGQPARAGVNSFGFSGTNAHLIVESHGTRDRESSNVASWAAGRERTVDSHAKDLVASPPATEQEPGVRRVRFIPLSGKSDSALRDLAKRYLSWLEQRAGGPSGSATAEEAWLADLAWTAGVGRSHFAHRAGVPFHDLASLRKGLSELVESPDSARPGVAKRVAFLYTGQASQWIGMGRGLYESEPIVRGILDRCDHLLRRERGTSLLDVMFGRAGPAAKLDNPAWMQPAIYALECALTALWKSLGIHPDAVVGHSLGELAAAEAAGVFTLADGLRFAAERGRLFERLPASGAMAAVFASLDRVSQALSEYNAETTGPGLSIAAENGAHQVVSGLAVDVEAISERFEAEELRVRRLRTTQGYHSVLVEPLLEDLGRILDGVPIASPSVNFVSNVTGRVVTAGESLDGGYWRRHAREPVAFGTSIGTLARLGIDVLVEIGPQAVLGPMATLAWPEDTDGAAHPVVLSSLLRPSGRDRDWGVEPEHAFMAAVSGAYTAGLDIDFAGLFHGEKRRRISLPSYPFQRRRHWIEAPKRARSPVGGHPLLGVRHESPTGEIRFEAEMAATDPEWLSDHRVFGRVVVPGATYGAMAVSALLAEGAESVVVEEMQLHAPLVLPANGEDVGRRVELVLSGSRAGPGRKVEVYSRGDGEDGWVLHVAGRVTSGARLPDADARAEMEGLRATMSRVDVPSLYRAKADKGVDLGLSFRVLRRVWAAPGESLAEVALSKELASTGPEVHPVLLDGCFQAVSAARGQAGGGDGETYLPFGWDRLWLAGELPDRVVCHMRMREAGVAHGGEHAGEEPREVLKADLRLLSIEGKTIGVVDGLTLKRATPAALLSAIEGLNDMLYEVVWRDGPLVGGTRSADFLVSPETVAVDVAAYSEYLVREGVEPAAWKALLADLEWLSRGYALAALERLGWERQKGATVNTSELRRQLRVVTDHSRLFARMLDLLTEGGVLEATSNGRLVVTAGRGDPLPHESLDNPGAFAAHLGERHPSGLNELELLRRSGGALAEVLRARADPLELLFGDVSRGAADHYRNSPASRAANRLLRDVLAALLAGLPEGRRLRVVEVGAGTGATTEWVMKQLPAGRFDYCYTDISAGFFSNAERRFGGNDAGMQYRTLDIERDPLDQGFGAHAYDLVIAANVLHATRDLGESLAHCRRLLAPSGHLLALENLRRRGWLDLSFGQLGGWWRFIDGYRPDHALAGPETWRQALREAGFVNGHVLGEGATGEHDVWDRGVILARQPAEVTESPGVWVLAVDRGGLAVELAERLALRGQTVVLADGGIQDAGGVTSEPGVIRVSVDGEIRASWRSLLEALPRDLPLKGIVHLMAVDGHGPESATEELAADLKRVVASALALAQGLLDTGVTPSQGIWIVTRGAQVLERERHGQLAGASLWGFGKAMAREAAHLNPRMIDLDPAGTRLPAGFTDELMSPDSETHIAHRAGQRRVARLVRAQAGTPRLNLPEGSGWRLKPDPGGALEKLQVGILPERALGSREVRVSVEAAGLNFKDVLGSVGAFDSGLLGREMCGRILETGSEVANFTPGDRVVGLGFGTFTPEVVTRAELVARVPEHMALSALATVPTVFVSAALCFEFVRLAKGDRVLIHAGAGGVGLAAIQWAQAAGAEVLATASAPKHAYLRSLGVRHVFDSRRTDFGAEILEATGGAGVNIVVNSLTGPGFIEASLSCLAAGGRFVEIGRRDIWSEERMSAERPDVAYFILALDVMKDQDVSRAGAALCQVVSRLVAGELKPLVHTRWPMAEAGSAMDFMRSAKHIGKIVLTAPPLAKGRLRDDRTYLVTGGLGGIGCAVAEWLAERGAGTIVLNGRRPPDPDAEGAIRGLRQRDVNVVVELADVADAAAVDAMLERMDATLPPLAGVIHSVGLLSDGSLTNQSWDRFRQVLWPKVLGGWHLHRATRSRDLDLFILFSSMAGVLGSPGQANHAAANVFLDQLAGHRRALGLAGQSIQWGAWSGLGEAEEHRARIARKLEAHGVGWISPQQGIKALDHLVRLDSATAGVAVVDWPVFAGSLDTPPPLFEDLLFLGEERSPDSGDASSDLLTTLRETLPEHRQRELASFLRREVQSVLRLASEPAPAVAFFDLGMDSLMAVELRNRLNRALAGALVVSNTAVFDYPDIISLARHLHEALGTVLDTGTHVVEPVRERSASSPQPHRRQAPETRVRFAGARRTDARRQDPPKRGRPDRIAIVGMACRFPAAPDLSAFWQLLDSGRSAVTDGRVDSGDWSGCIGDRATGEARDRRASFVEGLDGFDADFFGIAPKVAKAMDPEYRLLLETGWRALEDAGVDPARLRGSRTGIYVGVGFGEYRDLLSEAGEEIGLVGTTGGTAAGGLAALLGTEGPALPIDAAGASSLVAVDRAVGDLLRGEADMALVGAANAVLSPTVARTMRKLNAVSGVGRCNVFDVSADGFVRGEGCGVVLLKRLDDARADGDRIWAVIRGSAVINSGASTGLALPSDQAQRRVIEKAMSRAGVAPAEVDYLEAHGTGSALADPIEVRAAAAVFGRERAPERPLLIGSVKTNIGHLEEAAGMAGLIKVVLAMSHGEIPAHLNFCAPTPRIDWDRVPVRVAAVKTDWPNVANRPALAGVSAFGHSGSSGHLVLEQCARSRGNVAGPGTGHAPAGPPQPVAIALPRDEREWLTDPPPREDALGERRTRILPLSAKSGGALKELARSYLSFLDGQVGTVSPEGVTAWPALSDMAWTAGVGRSHFAWRAGIVFHGLASLRAGLKAVAAEAPRPNPPVTARMAFAYTGGESCQTGLGRELYECEPVARALMDRCDGIYRQHTGTSLVDAIFGRAGARRPLGDPTWAHPATYMLECALTALWSSLGIRPEVVVGCGIGELAAAQAAGVFGLEDGLRMASALGTVPMVAGVPVSPEPALDPLESILNGNAPAAPSLVMVSGSTGQRVESVEGLDSSYWRRLSLETGAPRPWERTITDLGVDVIVEVGAQPWLPRSLPGARPAGPLGSDRSRPPVVLSCNHQESDADGTEMGYSSFMVAVAAAYEAGLPISFAGLFAGEARRRVALPGYPFQRRSCWIDSSKDKAPALDSP